MSAPTIPNYQQLKRTYYYDGELLSKSNFVTEQQFVRDQAFNQNLALMAPGVIDGLQVTILPNGGAPILQVSAGSALCQAGMMVFVLSDTAVTTVSSAKDGTNYLILSYSDNINSNPEELQQSQLILESMQLTLATSNSHSDRQLILGTVDIASGVPSNVDMSAGTGRTASTLRLASSVGGGVGGDAVQDLAQVQPAPVGAAGKFKSPLSIGANPIANSWVSVDAQLSTGGGAGDASSALSITLGGAGPSTGSIALGDLEAGGDFAILTSAINGADVVFIDEVGEVFSQSTPASASNGARVTGALSTLGSIGTKTITPTATNRETYTIDASTLGSSPATITGPNGTAMVSYAGLVVLLIAGISELEKRVAALESK